MLFGVPLSIPSVASDDRSYMGIPISIVVVLLWRNLCHMLLKLKLTLGSFFFFQLSCAHDSMSEVSQN